jgi:transposase-like protein
MPKITISTYELFQMFPDQESARVYLEGRLWPAGPKCPVCGLGERITARKSGFYRCNQCKEDFTVRTGTIFERSHIPLHKWLYAMYLLLTARKGISSLQLSKEIGITQKSAWFMLQRIREALKENSFGRGKIGGGEGSAVESDETFIGGKVQNMHKDRRAKVEKRGPQANKTIVMGILDRDVRKVRAMVVPDVKRETLQNEILNNVKYGSTVYTDDAVGYDKLHYRFVHDVVNHTNEYVRGQVHTQGIENFWSLLKRTLRGTYVAVEPYHLRRYVDEQVFRFNNRKDGDRKLTDADRFAQAMRQVAGKRLTYSDLTGKSESPHHEAARTWKA